MANTPTPTNPATYLPVPGVTAPPTAEQVTASQQVAQNSTPSTTALTSNNFAVENQHLYLKDSTNASDTNINSLIANIADTSNIGPKGDKGDKGDPGDKGDRGDSGTVDYSLIFAMIQSAIGNLNFKNLRYVKPVPTVVYGTRSINLPTELYDAMIGEANVVISTYILGDPTLGSITSNGVFTAADVTTEQSLTITAHYIDNAGKAYTVSTDVLIKVLALVSLVVTGPNSINTPGSATYLASAVYTDASTKTVTTDPATSWALSTVDLGTLAQNILNAPATGVSKTGQVLAYYTEKGVQVSGSVTVTLIPPPPTAYYGSSAYPTAGSSGSVDWNTFVLGLTQGATTRATTFAINIANQQFGWYAAPVSFGITADTQFLDRDAGNLGGGWGGAMWDQNGKFTGSPPRVVQITVLGVTRPYNLWRTDYMSLASTHWQIL